MKPIRIDPSEISTESFAKRYPVVRIVDQYASQLEELFLIRNPRFRFEPAEENALQNFTDAHTAGLPMREAGAWFYFPWNKLLAHFLPDEMHQELRTSRNRYLITGDEQNRFREFRIGIAGLSVGSHAAHTIAMMGGAKQMRIADPDVISGSNLNRLRLDFSYVGTSKCDAVAQSIYQLDPYCDIDAFPQGVSEDNLEAFMSGLDVFVECMDQLELKIRSRLIARKLGIPVLMATDNGEGNIVDVERYDLDDKTELFNGVVGPLTLEEFKSFPPKDLLKLATRIAGVDVVHPQMLHSVSQIGRSLYAWPQLGNAATLTGVTIAYLVKRLANKLPLNGGRTEINLDAIFDPFYLRPEAVREREQQRKSGLQAIGFNVQ